MPDKGKGVRLKQVLKSNEVKSSEPEGVATWSDYDAKS